MGTGTGDMIRRCSEAGLPEPEFGVRDGFVTTVRRKLIDTNVVRKKSSGKSSGKSAHAILGLIRKNLGITIPELAKKLGKTERAVEKQIRQLRDDEIPARVGPAHGGHWEIPESAMSVRWGCFDSSERAVSVAILTEIMRRRIWRFQTRLVGG
jgi:ATP-dependent DNA helicase RecG